MPENRSVWNSNDQGVKEETFIQNGWRGGDGQLGWRGRGKEGAGGLGQARRRLAERVVLHLCADKPGGTTGERDRLRNPGFQYEEIKPQNL